jgi:DNA-binding GntR family transcriptional regulator
MARAARSTAKDIHAALTTAILTQRLAPGAKLSEEELCTVFGVSRTIVRAALQQLSHEKTVDLKPHRGAFVAAPDADESRAVFDARRAIEGALVERACDHATARGLAWLRAQIRHEEASHRAGDRTAMIKLSGDFHLCVAQLGKNPELYRFLQELIARTRLIVALYGTFGRGTCVLEEHTALAEAIASRNKRRARALMDDHMIKVEGQIDFANTVELKPDLTSLFSETTRLARRRA